MPRTTTYLLILLLVNSCFNNKETKTPTFQEYVQENNESTFRIKNNCPAVIRRVCKNKESKCVNLYLSDSSKNECKEIDKAKIKRICGKADVDLYKYDRECLNKPEPKNCEKNLTNKFDAKDLYKCPTLYKKICPIVCGIRYDVVDVRSVWPNEYAVVCLDDSIIDIKKNISYKSDREKHLCYSEAEKHIAGSGHRNWCVKYDYTYNGHQLGKYLQCASRLRLK
ncbi:MAG: hypothetical protein WCQ47_02740 [bacterium]